MWKKCFKQESTLHVLLLATSFQVLLGSISKSATINKALSKRRRLFQILMLYEIDAGDIKVAEHSFW